MMKLWLDDIRRTPEGWVRAHSVNEAIKLIEEAGDAFEFASLDHDLGVYAEDGGDGVKLTYWMAEHNVFPSKGIRVHSANPVGVDNMMSDIDYRDPYGDAETSIYGFDRHIRGEWPPGGWPIAGMY